MNLTLSPDKRFLYIESCIEPEYDQLKLSLTKRIASWRYHPLVKRGVWDGFVSFLKGSKMPSGLWKECMDIGKKYNFEVQLNGILKLFNIDVDKDEFHAWVTRFFEGFEKQPRDYQIETAYQILRYRRCLAELATSSGKSLIMFMIIAYMRDQGYAERVLLIVPNVQLVIQMADDFTEYNFRDELPLAIQQIYAGSKIKEKSNLVVGTYQSLVKKEKAYFQQFDAVIVDETHRANSNSIRKILDFCWHMDYRFGLSGTVPKDEVGRLTLTANTGPLVKNISANYLIDRGFISPVNVKVIMMNYATNEQKEAFKILYDNSDEGSKNLAMEQKFIIASKKRLDFVTGIIKKVNKNSLVLFHRIEHGKLLYNTLRDEYDGEVYYVDGGTDADTRDRYKKLMEEDERKILVASFGTFSTGINITNIHNIFLTESFKSETIIRQSIGRGLRKHATKGKLIIIDFVDDFRYKYFTPKGKERIYKNYMLRHGESRLSIYKEQKFPYKIKRISF